MIPRGINKYLTIVLLGCFLIIACSHTKQVNNYYVISYHDSIKGNYYHQHGLLAPPKVLVGTYNFIVDVKGNYYFYSFAPSVLIKGVCDDDFDYGTKVLNHLQPNDIRVIPKGSEEKFMMSNVINMAEKSLYKSIVIASYSDSVNNDVISFLIKFQNDTSKHITLLIRHIQKRELVVLNDKLKKR